MRIPRRIRCDRLEKAVLLEQAFRLQIAANHGIRILTDLELSLYSPLTPLPVIGLCPIVLRHHLDKLPGQRRVLGLAYPQIR